MGFIHAKEGETEKKRNKEESAKIGKGLGVAGAGASCSHCRPSAHLTKPTPL